MVVFEVQIAYQWILGKGVGVQDMYEIMSQIEDFKIFQTSKQISEIGNKDKIRPMSSTATVVTHSEMFLN